MQIFLEDAQNTYDYTESIKFIITSLITLAEVEGKEESLRVLFDLDANLIKEILLIFGPTKPLLLTPDSRRIFMIFLQNQRHINIYLSSKL